LRWCHINEPPPPHASKLKATNPWLQIEIMLLQKNVTGETVWITIMKVAERLI
jgi:hypothetical protein